jgi:hypothetical protein
MPWKNSKETNNGNPIPKKKSSAFGGLFAVSMKEE